MLSTEADPMELIFSTQEPTLSDEEKRLQGLAEHEPFGYDYGSGDYNFTYDYNITDSFVVPLDEAFPVILTYTLTFIIGVIGNGLVMFSIAYYRRMRTTTNVFLFSLASADLLLILVCVPVKAIRFLTFSWTMGEFLCKGVIYIQNVTMICSVFTLTCISLERVVAVLFPLKARYICTTARAQLMVLSVWGLSFLIAIPIIFGQTHKEVGVKYKAYWCLKLFPYTEGIIYDLGMLILMFVLPMSIMTVSYLIICWKIWHVSAMRADMRSGRVIAPAKGQRLRSDGSGLEHTLLTTPSDTSGGQRGYYKQDTNQDNQTTMQLVLMLVVVVLLFAICWGPFLFDNVLTAFRFHHYLHYGHLKPMRKAFHLMSYINSCVNPIVYAFMSKNFRQSFMFAICGCMKGRAFVRAYRFSMSLAHTRTSVISVNGRNKTTFQNRREKSSSSDNDYTQAPTTSPEEVELNAMADEL